MIKILILLIIALNISASEVTKSSKLCQKYFYHFETKYNIPARLVEATSTHESGKLMNNELIAWPWTINVGGKGYYFDSKEAAIAKTKEYINKGYKSIDVGCMQINLKYHPNAFENLEQAFEPESNIEYGSKLIKSHYNRTKEWRSAIAKYHSGYKRVGYKYANKVITLWKRKKFSNLPI